MMNKKILWIVAVALVVLAFSPFGMFFIVDERQQAVRTVFGDPRGVVKEAGLYLKIPFIEKITFFEKRILEWDGDPGQYPTKDKRYIWVDTTARWRIVDPLKFYQTLNNEMSALARLDDILDSAARTVVGKNRLLEVVRSSNRMLKEIEEMEKASSEEKRDYISVGDFEKIQVGRKALMAEMYDIASPKVKDYGIELVDIKIKRINYVEEVQRKVFDRMIAERRQAAAEYISEGRGEKARVQGEIEKELRRISSEAYKKSQEIRGDAEKKALEIYSEAYSKGEEFFAFQRKLDIYRSAFLANTAFILSTNSSLLDLFNGIAEDAK